MATVLEPNLTSIDLQWRLCGVPIRIHPLFWAASAGLGCRYYAEPPAGGIGYFSFWMFAVLIAVLVHNLGQVFMGRLFGMRGDVVLYGLGGLCLGVASLPSRWQRIIVLLTGPLVNFLCVALVWSLPFIPFPTFFREWGLAPAIATGAAIFSRINIFWGLLNLIPLLPLTGGQLTGEIAASLFGSRGSAAASGLSLVAAMWLALWVTLELSLHLDQRFDERYALLLFQDGVLLLFCFLFWLYSFRAMFPEPHHRPTT